MRAMFAVPAFLRRKAPTASCFVCGRSNWIRTWPVVFAPATPETPEAPAAPLAPFDTVVLELEPQPPSAIATRVAAAAPAIAARNPCRFFRAPPMRERYLALADVVVDAEDRQVHRDHDEAHDATDDADEERLDQRGELLDLRGDIG